MRPSWLPRVRECLDAIWAGAIAGMLVGALLFIVTR